MARSCKTGGWGRLVEGLSWAVLQQGGYRVEPVVMQQQLPYESRIQQLLTGTSNNCRKSSFTRNDSKAYLAEGVLISQQSNTGKYRSLYFFSSTLHVDLYSPFPPVTRKAIRRFRAIRSEQLGAQNIKNSTCFSPSTLVPCSLISWHLVSPSFKPASWLPLRCLSYFTITIAKFNSSQSQICPPLDAASSLLHCCPFIY